MSSPSPTPPPAVADDLRAARRGDAAAWGRLLDRFRPYLLLLAEVQVGKRLRGKADPADLVQEAALQAHRGFAGFRGATEAEFVEWLHAILADRLAKLVRRYHGTQARDPRLERSLTEAVADSSRLLDRVLVDPGTSPSGRAAAREEVVRVAAALDRLPADHKRVIVLRQLEGLPFAEVGASMGRSADAATQLWVRAIRGLREALGPP